MRRLLLLAALTICCYASRAAVDLSATSTEFIGEGVKYTQLTFKDDKKQVTYVLPQLWSWRGGGTQVQLTPANTSRVSAVIEAAHLEAPVALDDETVASMRQQFITYLPPATNAAKLVSEERDPVPLGGSLRSYEITASYQAMGDTYIRSVLFVNTADTQLRFKFTAPKAEFDALHRTFRASLTSWQWVTPQAADSGAVAAK